MSNNKPQTWQGLTLSSNGQGFAAELKNLTPPKIKTKTETWRAGNMPGEVNVPMGTEATTIAFEISREDARIGVLRAVVGRNSIFIVRGTTDEFGKKRAVQWIVDGRINDSDSGGIKTGQFVSLKIVADVYRYVKTVDGAPVEAIDMFNGELSFGGDDVWASVRDLLSL